MEDKKNEVVGNMGSVAKLIQAPSEYIQPDPPTFDQKDGLVVKVIYNPSKNHIHVEAEIEDGDELVLMMLKKAYDAWKKRVLENIFKYEEKT